MGNNFFLLGGNNVFVCGGKNKFSWVRGGEQLFLGGGGLITFILEVVTTFSCWGVTTFLIVFLSRYITILIFTVPVNTPHTCSHLAHTYTYTYMYIHIYAYTYRYIHILHCNTSPSRNVSILLFTVPVNTPLTCSHTPTHIHIHTYTCMYIHVYIYTCIAILAKSKCIDFDVYGTCGRASYMFTYTHAYTYNTCTYMYIHVHTYTCIAILAKSKCIGFDVTVPVNTCHTCFEGWRNLDFWGFTQYIHLTGPHSMYPFYPHTADSSHTAKLLMYPFSYSGARTGPFPYYPCFCMFCVNAW